MIIFSFIRTLLLITLLLLMTLITTCILIFKLAKAPNQCKPCITCRNKFFGYNYRCYYPSQHNDTYFAAIKFCESLDAILTTDAKVNFLIPNGWVYQRGDMVNGQCPSTSGFINCTTKLFFFCECREIIACCKHA